MAARAYWQGQIRLALVSIPVEIYSASQSGAKISFRQIHEPSGKRISYEKVVEEFIKRNRARDEGMPHQYDALEVAGDGVPADTESPETNQQGN